MIFPYRVQEFFQKGDPDGSWVFIERPHIPINLIARDGRVVGVPALVDSGADVSFIGPIYAEFLGIDIKSGRFEQCQGVAGISDCYLHEGITIEVGGDRFQISADFAQSWPHDFVILGRRDFFDRFKVVIDESKKHVELTLHSPIVGKVADK